MAAGVALRGALRAQQAAVRSRHVARAPLVAAVSASPTVRRNVRLDRAVRQPRRQRRRRR